MRGVALALGLLLPAVASADPWTDAADRLAASVAPGARRVGEHLQSGPTVMTDWYVTLSPGQCYWFAGAGADTLKVFYLYLWDPGNKRLATRKPKGNQVVMAHCPAVPGRYHVQGKVAGDGPYRVAVFARPGNPGDVLEDGTIVTVGKSAPPPLTPPPPAPPVARAPAPPPPPPPPPAPPRVIDDGRTPHGGNASLLVSCDCGAMEIYVDGQLLNVRGGQGRWDGLGSGHHAVKIVAWTGLFTRKTWFDGIVNLWPNMESRVQVSAGGMQLLGKSPAPPPAPVRRAASEATAQIIDDALDTVRDAAEVNRDQDSRCTDRVGGKLEVLTELLKDLRRAPNPRRFAELDRKIRDASEYIEDSCPPRATQALLRKMSRLSQRVQEARASVESAP